MIALFESFKDYVTETVKYFFNTGFKKGKDIFSDKYKNKVLKLDKSVVKSSLLWLQDNQFISNEDIETYEDLRIYRNMLSHELMDLLFKGVQDKLIPKLIKLIELRNKIEKEWILNVEIPTGCYADEDIDIKNVEADDIITSSQIINHLLFDMILNDGKKVSEYKKQFEAIYKSQTGDEF